MQLEPRDLVVVGASAGGVEALRSFVAGLPRELPAAVAVVLHLPAGGTSALPSILGRSGPLPAVSARQGMALEPGTIFVAPPDHHLVVQDLDDALYQGMPGSVLRHLKADQVLPAADLGEAVRRCAGELVETTSAPEPSALLKLETRFAVQQTVEVNKMGEPSGFSCADCAGTLVELDAERKRFRCRVGHAWTADALLDAQADTLERALWTALRTLEER